MKVYYFASPYSSKNPFTKWKRWYLTLKWAAHLTKLGYTLLEPIAMCHWQSTLFNLPPGYKFWQRRDREFILRSDGMIILAIDGWKESVGVTDEIYYAKLKKKPIYVLDPKLKTFKGNIRLIPLDKYVEKE